MLKKEVRFPQDNVRPHTVHVTTNLIEQFRSDIVTRPPCSPGIVPNDYYIFPEMEKHLGRMHFATEEKLKDVILSYLRGAVGEFYGSDIKKLVHGMQKCISLNGNYVEK